VLACAWALFPLSGPLFPSSTPRQPTSLTRPCAQLPAHQRLPCGAANPSRQAPHVARALVPLPRGSHVARHCHAAAPQLRADSSWLMHGARMPGLPSISRRIRNWRSSCRANSADPEPDPHPSASIKACPGRENLHDAMNSELEETGEGEPEGVREKKSVAAHQTRRVLAWVCASLLRDYQSRVADS
jgi:hypothetical protein